VILDYSSPMRQSPSSRGGLLSEFWDLTSKKREVCNGLLNVLGWSQGDIAGHYGT